MEFSMNDVRAFVFAIIYAIAGILLLALAYWVFDRLTPNDLGKAIFEDKNVAAAVAVGLFILGVATIIAAAIHG